MERQRKHERKKHRDGSLNGLYLAFTAIVIVLVMVGASIVFFRVNHVTVEGNVHYTEEQVVEVSGVQKGDNLMLTSPTAVAARLRTEMPYINSVSIVRRLPDTLAIRLEESGAQAAVYDGFGSWWLMDVSGRLLEQVEASEETMEDFNSGSSGEGEAPTEGDPSAASSGVAPEERPVPLPPEGYPYINGLVLDAPVKGSILRVHANSSSNRKLMLSSLIELLEALQESELLGKVVSIDVSAESSLVVDYDGFLSIRLLLDMDYRYQTRMIGKVLEGHIAQNWSSGDTGVLDMTFEDGNPRLAKNKIS